MSNTICITGATSGLGQATARLFVKNGWKVIGTGRREDRLQSLKQELGDSFFGLTFDIRDRAQTFAAFGSLPENFAAVDVLMNNAGLFAGHGLVQNADMDAWERMVDTNILGLLHCTRTVLPGMLARKHGHIVNIGSATGTRAFPTGNVYGASKAFVRLFSDNMRADLLGTPIRVTCISPGRTRTEFALVHNDGDVESMEQEYRQGQPLLPEDIAHTVWWVINCPPHMDVTQIEIMPVCQADGGVRFQDVAR
ncbi:SDR family NAD(P)-dependent oxidoreductase [uncultured Mailhella sp.]|uniref:SDR family NAD(P)-dependent oxidoreductase n=1 Tax=uncultured Mailhella sp. TaxID=1981031 RepID=UPI002603E109|nr:SDR family NAD(P)-dependent oxidoreductase [uncultured Mailhella sp.]